MPSIANTPSAPCSPMRERISFVVDSLEKANDILKGIEDKLFGLNQCEAPGKASPPQNVQNDIDRSAAAAERLLNRLDSINSRL